MSDVFSKRFWRNIAVRVLPEFVKAPLRRRLQGYCDQKPLFNLEIAANGDILEIVIDGKISFLLPRAMEDELRHYFVGNVEYAEEMLGFINVAGEGRLLFDVGAAHGMFSAVFCACSPQNRVVAYEPSPAWLPVFEPMVKLNKFADRIKLEPLAIGDTQSTIQFHCDPQSGFLQIMPAGDSQQMVPVRVTTIDAECERLNLQPDILKVDVEGYELEALRGADKLLRTKKPAVSLELHLNYLEERGIEPKEVCDLLEAHQYEFYSGKLEKINAGDIYDSIKPVVRFIAR